MILSMNLKIKKAFVEDAKEVYQILLLCGNHLEKHFGLGHWSPPYPLESIKNNILEREVYLIYQENKAVATFTLGTTPIAIYDPDRWQTNPSQAMYLNRLAVLPEFQAKSLGSWCMEKIEEIARQANCQALRFDAVAKHQKLLSFYTRLGYQNLGLWHLNDARGVKWDVVLFEKAL